jgi:hypothetical protein
MQYNTIQYRKTAATMRGIAVTQFADLKLLTNFLTLLQGACFSLIRGNTITHAADKVFSGILDDSCETPKMLFPHS